MIVFAVFGLQWLVDTLPHSARLQHQEYKCSWIQSTSSIAFEIILGFEPLWLAGGLEPHSRASKKASKVFPLFKTPSESRLSIYRLILLCSHSESSTSKPDQPAGDGRCSAIRHRWAL
ncbi:hypothetical protein FRB91_001067 [Serendipita sp. 411]|nr:hypothetical protein FRB91_001067 [Serendipita sp. 411]